MSGQARLRELGLIRDQVELGPLTTYKAGGPARLFAEPRSMTDLNELIASGLTTESPILVLGRGSNLVVADAGFDGLVVHLAGEFSGMTLTGDEVVAGGAAPLPRVARSAVEAGMLGVEFFVGVPGSVGGAVHQNAGCFGVETADRLISAQLLDLVTGERREPGPGGLDLAYRHSNVAAGEVVVSARFRVREGNAERGKGLMREITRWRKEHQPGGTLNAGSVFKNPPGTTAGELIDRLGLKGMRVGDVAVSEKHANFFVAGAGATASQIRELVELVKDTVRELSGTILEPEIQFVGFER